MRDSYRHPHQGKLNKNTKELMRQGKIRKSNLRKTRAKSRGKLASLLLGQQLRFLKKYQQSQEGFTDFLPWKEFVHGNRLQTGFGCLPSVLLFMLQRQEPRHSIPSPPSPAGLHCRFCPPSRGCGSSKGFTAPPSVFSPPWSRQLGSLTAVSRAS